MAAQAPPVRGFAFRHNCPLRALLREYFPNLFATPTGIVPLSMLSEKLNQIIDQKLNVTDAYLDLFEVTDLLPSIEEINRQVDVLRQDIKRLVLTPLNLSDLNEKDIEGILLPFCTHYNHLDTLNIPVHTAATPATLCFD